MKFFFSLYFTVPARRTFFAFLSGLDYDKDGKTSLQHCKQVFSIWKDVQRKGLVSLELILGNTKSYLGSLVLFLDYGISQKMTGSPEEARVVIMEMKRMQKRMRKRVQRRRTEMEIDIGKRFTVTWNYQILKDNSKLCYA